MALQACKTDLYSGLTQREANEIIAALATRDIYSSKASVDEKTWSVQVEEGDLPAAVTTLRAFGLPRTTHQSIGDVFKKSGLVSSPSEERIRFIYAMSEELSNTISQIDGIVAARVHVVIPNQNPLSEKTAPASASVFIKHRPELNVTVIAPAIKSLVQRSVQGLSYDDVSISAFATQVDPDVRREFGSTAGIARWGALAFFVVALLGIAWMWRGGRLSRSADQRAHMDKHEEVRGARTSQRVARRA